LIKSAVCQDFFAQNAIYQHLGDNFYFATTDCVIPPKNASAAVFYQQIALNLWITYAIIIGIHIDRRRPMANNILEMALERLERDFPPSSLSAWFDDATVVSFTDNRLVLHSPVQFKKEFIDHKFIEPLQNALYELTGDQITVVVVTGEYTAPTTSTSPYD